MSGQPYKYYTDPTKFRSEYMETLGLQADINEMNLEANRTYKETGQLPPVSQMKDTRSPSEILLDYEKLKIDLIKSISKLSSSQFGQDVVSRIIKSPLNSDNKLLVFAAQRIEDIVFNVKKLYRYGIKGDSGDVEQFVNFIETMYNDKNALASQTKSFMDSQGIKKMETASTIFSSVREVLYSVGVQQANFQKFHNEIQNALIYTYGADVADRVFDNYDYNETEMTSREIVKLINALTKAISIKPESVTELERKLFTATGDTGGLRGITPGDIEIQDYDIIRSYLDFIRTGIPAKGQLISISKQLEVYINQLKESVKSINPSNTTILSAITTNFIKINTIQRNLLNALQPKEEWNSVSILRVYEEGIRLLQKYSSGSGREQYTQTPTEYQPEYHSEPLQYIENPAEVGQFGALPDHEQYDGPFEHSEAALEETDEGFNETARRGAINEIKFVQEDIEKFKKVIDGLYERISNVQGGTEEYRRLEKDIIETEREYDSANIYYEQIMDSYNQQYGEYTGSGIKKKGRGRPKGCGIIKPKTFTDSFKKNIHIDKGIMESPRYVKFGRYLINNHKLNNEDTFMIRRPSGGNIIEFPSTKISKNMVSVVKKMISGGSITYSDISKLSEPEKVYLHKISKKSNILDKFDIPAPSKDEKEKDIHQFEVMKGEIMAGNDNKELIKKFKLHIVKLSKNNTLPKREVAEILEDLISLGL